MGHPHVSRKPTAHHKPIPKSDIKVQVNEVIVPVTVTSSSRLACQNNLRELYAALTGYADTHGGRLPEVGTEQVPQ